MKKWETGSERREQRQSERKGRDHSFELSDLAGWVNQRKEMKMTRGKRRKKTVFQGIVFFLFQKKSGSDWLAWKTIADDWREEKKVFSLKKMFSTARAFTSMESSESAVITFELKNSQEKKTPT